MKPRRAVVCREGIKYRGAVRAIHYLNPDWQVGAPWPANQGMTRGGCGTGYRYFETQDWDKVTCKVCLRSRRAREEESEELELPEGIVRSDYRGSYLWQTRNGGLPEPKKTVLWKESDEQG